MEVAEVDFKIKNPWLKKCCPEMWQPDKKKIDFLRSHFFMLRCRIYVKESPPLDGPNGGWPKVRFAPKVSQGDLAHAALLGGW